MNTETCEVCDRPLKECDCCSECGHVCSLDYGETFCPVCLPEPEPVQTQLDERYMRHALKEAEAGFSRNEVPVGAVLVLNNRIIASAHNRKEATNDPTAHAEMIVIRKAAADIDNWRLTDSTLYVTKEPCVMCAGAMIHARVARLVYGCRDKKYGAVTSQYRLGSDGRLNHGMKVLPGVLEDQCSEILKRFFAGLR